MTTNVLCGSTRKMGRSVLRIRDSSGSDVVFGVEGSSISAPSVTKIIKLV